MSSIKLNGVAKGAAREAWAEALVTLAGALAAAEAAREAWEEAALAEALVVADAAKPLDSVLAALDGAIKREKERNG